MADYPSTIHSPEKFAGSLPAGFDGVFDWSWTAKCWDNPRDKPQDIDLFKERNGQFLVAETKRPGVELPLGQRIALERLHSLGCFTILLIWGKPLPEAGEVWFPGTRKVEAFSGVDGAVAIVRRWYQWADGPGARDKTRRLR